MFLVFNKEKIYTYMISVFTVAVLFFVASNVSRSQRNAVETSTKAIENMISNNIIENLIGIENE